ncbi:MAG: hypothetical protein Q4F28_01450 [Eubacteriales bacterium]|nr:hypothetical protein [Eubacteriales bacterium]
MKRIIMLTLSFFCVFMLVGCTTNQSSNMKLETNNSVDMKELREKYPEYFELGDFKGIEVYVWQMAENSYRCGMMSGTNRNKTDEEIWGLQEKSLSVEETKAILNEIGVEENSIIVIPIAQPYSSYLYEIDDAYKEKVLDLFKN